MREKGKNMEIEKKLKERNKGKETEEKDKREKCFKNSKGRNK